MRLVILILLFTVSACSGSKKTSVPYEPEATDRLMLQRTGCYGTCPIYEIVIFGNGIVSYEGKRYTDKTGKFVGQLDAESTQALFEKAASLAWEKYPDEFPIDNVDFPQFFIGIEIENISNKVKANSQSAVELIDLSKEIDEKVEGLSWKPQ